MTSSIPLNTTAVTDRVRSVLEGSSAAGGATPAQALASALGGSRTDGITGTGFGLLDSDKPAPATTRATDPSQGSAGALSKRRRSEDPILAAFKNLGIA